MLRSVTRRALRALLVMVALYSILCAALAPIGAFARSGSAAYQSTGQKPPAHVALTAPGLPSEPAPTPGPAPEADTPLTLDLLSLTPAAVRPGDTLEARVSITNTTDAPLENVALQLSSFTSRITDRTLADEWSATAPAQTSRRGTVRGTSAARTLAQGETAEFTVRIPADTLGYSRDESLWGPRRVALTAVTGATTAPDAADSSANATPVATLRTFLVWQPADHTPSVSLAYLAPLASTDPALVATNPEAFEKDVREGAFAAQWEIAQRDDVSWWLDPSMLAELKVPEGMSTVEEARLSLEAKTPTPSPSASPATPTAPPASDAGGAKETPSTPATARAAGTPWGPNSAWDERRSSLIDAARTHDVTLAPFALASPATARSTTRLLENEAASAAQSAGLAAAPTLMRVESGAVTAKAVRSSGAQTALVPAESFYSSLSPSVTPSGYAQIEGGGEPATPLLGYDTRLTRLSERLADHNDPELSVQRALADTALLAGESASAPRTILLAPSPTSRLNPARTSRMLDALGAAPWVTHASASTLVKAAKAGEGTTSISGESGNYWVGKVNKLHAIGEKSDASPARIDPEAQKVPAGASGRVEKSLTKLGDVRAVLEDPSYLYAAILLAASGVSTPLFEDPHAHVTRLAHLNTVTEANAKRISLTLAGTYNLVSNEASIPYTVHNGFSTPVTLNPSVSFSQRIAKAGATLEPVTLPALTTGDNAIPVEAVRSGSGSFTVMITNGDDVVLDSRKSQLSVNPEWENWTTLIAMVLLAALVITGVIRAGRTKSDARSPALTEPEDLASVDHPDAPPHSRVEH
ncbi:DUF6049 family protein [Dermabacter sp. HSID17554]|uniref:DUF6049 family protein n=1 Tax=Dermabacter sp. HSID17554 TaxID=2419511 RepID=UPI000F89D153|nr:DUF6049 family protein [Dermabacter sp. HSID17554]RUP86441.1 hypothetical protein D8M36_03340 [Dermabacter sp. HSID17554]